MSARRDKGPGARNSVKRLLGPREGVRFIGEPFASRTVCVCQRAPGRDGSPELRGGATVTVRADASLPATSSPIAAAARAGLLLLAALLGLGSRSGLETMTFIAVVIVLALGGTLLPGGHRVAWVLLVGEVVVAVGGVVVGAAVDPLLICLTSTALSAGLAGGYVPAVLTTGAASAILLGYRLLHTWTAGAVRGFTPRAAQWVAIALVMGLLAGRIRGLTGEDQPLDDRYAEAHRLLAQLRAVSRNLPGSLDPGSVAQTLLAECITAGGCEFGAVFLQVGGDQLVPLALHGYQRVPWRASLSEPGPIQRAWLSGAVVVDRRPPDRDGLRRGSTLLVLPMTVQEQRVGLVALESRGTSELLAPDIRILAAVVARNALPLETAALFDELRMGAAAEERSRLAREMHDGIAQDLAFLGYEVDALIGALRQPVPEAGVEQARALRLRITDLIGELRLSITDLRSSVGPARGLGAALSEYARSVGTSTGMTVLLSLTEGSTRLSSDVEVELLRIAHEAITLARRRPGARNLWVTLTVDPPAAGLIIEDDGRNDGAGLDDDRKGTRVMHERAERLGALLTSMPRTPTGTRVSVNLTGVVRDHDRSSG